MYDEGRVIRWGFIDPALAEALNSLAAAENRFNMASGAEEVDAAILDLKAAELHLRAVLQRARIEATRKEALPCLKRSPFTVFRRPNLKNQRVTALRSNPAATLARKYTETEQG
ncbi:MAG: hypothetical protein BPH100C_203 [Phage 5P_2]|nr:MAG: hypothetical protein BPH100C_203 [Phage 5P_2]